MLSEQGPFYKNTNRAPNPVNAVTLPNMSVTVFVALLRATISRFDLPVWEAAAAALLESAAIRDWVGFMAGGLATMFIGATGVPSNSYKLRWTPPPGNGKIRHSLNNMG